MVINIRNALVVLIAIALTAAVLLVTGRPLPQGDSFNEDPPFFTISEFPSTNEADYAAIMELAAAFLESPEWREEAASVEVWSLADVAPLTRRGVRIGIYGDVQFERQLSLPGPLGFIRCGGNETWARLGSLRLVASASGS